ncbi:MAG: endonuclease NucS [Nanoarchaeota archaeon]
MHDFAVDISGALQRRETVVFSMNCSIQYSGRAESFLPDGDRLVIIKQDGTLLVHQPQGSAPVNYMAEGSEHSLVQDSSGLRLLSRNRARKEQLAITINHLHFIQSKQMVDGRKIELAGSERDMAEMLFQQPSLIEEGFTPLSREEHTRYGFIDIFGFDRDNVLVVIECKRYTADLAAVTQLRRYVERVKKRRGLEKVRGVIAAPAISKNALRMLHDLGFSFRKVTPPRYLEEHGKRQRRLGDFHSGP